jgi:beta-mannanase
MNGNWYPWSGAQNGGATGGPAKYVAAYKHVHDVFVAEGALNVQWIWCPDNADVPNETWNHWTAYYPGDSYVDWIGFDGYNWGSTQPWGWQSFDTVFQQIYAAYAGSGKPLIVGETASTELGGNKADWILGMDTSVMSAFPALKAIVWFEINKETDWRVESSPASLSAFQQVARDPYFNP